jgi:protein involved in polysaccharide export with SLBB domain
MESSRTHLVSDAAVHRQWPVNLRILLLAICVICTGCAALTNPVGDGVPVRRLPPEVFGKPREEEQTIPLSLLRQKPTTVYRLEPGDVLGIYIEGVLGEANQPIPVRVSENEGRAPSIGYPIPVREDGTIALPFVPPIPVRGMTVPEVREAIDRAYTVTQKLLKPGRERILVDLQQPRTFRILVIRQDSGGLTVGAGGQGAGTIGGSLGNTKRGTGYELHLRAGENDVLTALARTGGFPGLDANNEVIIERGAASGMSPAEVKCVIQGAGGQRPGAGQKIRIPLRLRPDEPITFRPEDILLKEGDILFIEARDTEVFYTAGLLGSGQYVLPRDYDLNVVEAICLVKGPLINGGLNTNNLSGNLLQNGVGFDSPSLVSIIRRTPNNNQIIIKVDLNRAMRDPRQRILIQPKDILVLQETVGEAVVRYITDQFHLNFIGTILRQADATATTTIDVP